LELFLDLKLIERFHCIGATDPAGADAGLDAIGDLATGVLAGLGIGVT